MGQEEPVPIDEFIKEVIVPDSKKTLNLQIHLEQPHGESNLHPHVVGTTKTRMLMEIVCRLLLLAC